MAEYLNQEMCVKEKKFFSSYDKLKKVVKETRLKIKGDVNGSEVEGLMDELEEKQETLLGVFEELRSLRAPDPEIRRKMDAASAMSQDLLHILQELLVLDDVPYDPVDREDTLQRLLQTSYARSVYGSTVSRITRTSRRSEVSSTELTVERAKAEAELAVKEAEIRMNGAIEEQRKKLQVLEDQRDLRKLQARVQVLSVAESSNADRRSCREGSSVCSGSQANKARATQLENHSITSCNLRNNSSIVNHTVDCAVRRNSSSDGVSE